MATIPRDPSLDSTLALAREGYRFVTNHCERLSSDLFETRLLGRRTICLRGDEAARVFYDTGRFARHGALPGRILKVLFGQGGVQGLDDEAHQRRKRMLMSLMDPGSVDELARLTDEEWSARLDDWERGDGLVLMDEVGQILCRAVCRWAGVPVVESQVRRRTRDLHALFEDAVAVGPRYWHGRLVRSGAEQGVAALVERVRDGRLAVGEGRALHTISTYRDPGGRLLDPRVAAVEVLNILRPTVAVDRFITFAALALHEYPQWRDRLRAGDEDLEPFVQEVRRFYPFFPFVGARTRTAFDWNGYHFPRGRRTILDLYGTDHHPDIWERPDEFRPERFRTWDRSAYNFIPQGGGDHYANHRCAGEWITIALMKTAVTALTRRMRYRVPQQDLRIDLRTMPALPASGFVIADVERTADVRQAA